MREQKQKASLLGTRLWQVTRTKPWRAPLKRKYPGVRVEVFRAGGSELMPRMSEEAKARRPTFDVLETTYDFMMVARTTALTRPYNSPALANYPSEAKEKADKGLTFWTIFRESYMGFGYNKESNSADAVPKGFDGLASSATQRENGITLNESSARMIGAMIKIKGEAFVKKLKAQDIRVYTVSSAALVDLMASGELGASFHIYRNHAMVSAERGSPVGWVPMELVPTNSGCVALSRATAPPARRRSFRRFPCLARKRAKYWKNSSTAIRRMRCRSSAGIPALAVLLEQFERDSRKWERLAKEISQR